MRMTKKFYLPSLGLGITIFLLLAAAEKIAALKGSSSVFSEPLKKAVLWDIDGTLADSYQLCFDATNEVLSRNGHSPVDAASYKVGTQYPTDLRFAWHVDPACTEAASPEGVRLGHEFDALYIAQVSPATAPFYPGLAERVVRPLGAAGVRQGALSNAVGGYVRAVLAANGVAALFEVQWGVDEVPAAKPSPEGLRACAAALGLAPGECVYVGDSPSDGRAARAAGMAAVGVAWGHGGGGQEGGAAAAAAVLGKDFDAVVERSEELWACLAGLCGLEVESTQLR